MCGIIGYIGKKKAADILTEGLKRLEYRGYDSVGIAVASEKGIEIRKEKGAVDDVSQALQFSSISGTRGISHCRWATHGVPCKDNAHPHSDCSGKVAIVHNGVIENFHEIKQLLIKKGHRFSSETDSEVIAHLIEEAMKTKKPLDAFFDAVGKLQGSYAIAALIVGEDRIFVARKNSPLVIGVGNGEMFCASDIPAMLKHTRTFVVLEEGDRAILTPHGYKIYDVNNNETVRRPITVDWGIEMAERGGYEHFMLKEIYDQKHFIREALTADVAAGKKLLDEYENIDIIGCGTSYHAALILKILIQRYLRKRTDAIIASEYMHISNSDNKTLVIAISQSGETADTLQAVRTAKSRDAKILAITNVVQSSLARLADEVIYLNAGPEVSVVATKTFTSQLAVIYKLILPQYRDEIPKIIDKMLNNEEKIKKIADTIATKKDVFFIGRGLSYPIAMEGALKLKEISYIHAEAYAGGELKHGPLSLIEQGMPVIALAPKDETLTKIYGNIKEVKARGALVIALTNDDDVKKEADFVIELPDIDNELYPFALIIPLQYLAYYTCVRKGYNPDRPRSLAKSVTVE
jgi:glucosamine--fructose-6-phosphate aminotransferase (isomerizing)